MPGLLGPALLKICVLLKLQRVLMTLFAPDTGLIPRGRRMGPSLGGAYPIEGNVDMSTGNVGIR